MCGQRKVNFVKMPELLFFLLRITLFKFNFFTLVSHGNLRNYISHYFRVIIF